MREHRWTGCCSRRRRGTDPAVVDGLRGNGLHVVTMLRRLDTKARRSGDTDFRLGMTLAAEPPDPPRHERIAFIGGGAKRIAGARSRDRLSRNAGALWIGHRPGGDCLPTREEGARAIDTLLQGSRPTRPPCSATTTSAPSACFWAWPTAGSLPGATAPSSASTTSLKAALYRPALTTIAIDARRIGEEAASLLLRRIKSPKGAPESIILPPSLIVRSSCGRHAPHITSREIPRRFRQHAGPKGGKIDDETVFDEDASCLQRHRARRADRHGACRRRR